MARYHAQRDCHWNGRYWRRGEAYDGPEKPPHHFIPEDVPIPPEVTPRLGTKINAKNPYKPLRAPSGPADKDLPVGVPGKGMPEVSIKAEPPKAKAK